MLRTVRLANRPTDDSLLKLVTPGDDVPVLFRIMLSQEGNRSQEKDSVYQQLKFMILNIVIVDKRKIASHFIPLYPAMVPIVLGSSRNRDFHLTSDKKNPTAVPLLPDLVSVSGEKSQNRPTMARARPTIRNARPTIGWSEQREAGAMATGLPSLSLFSAPWAWAQPCGGRYH